MVLGRLRQISFCGLFLLGCLGLCFQKGTDAAEKTRKPVMKTLKYDPAAPKAELFQAMEDEKVSVRLVAKDEFEGHLLVENKTDAPLTIQLPDAFVGVQVLPQFGGGGGGFGGGGQGGGGFGGGGQGGGGGQAAGGGFGGGGQGGGQGGGGFGGGGGAFSIPVGTIAKVPVTTVCLEHGKKSPRQSMNYTIVPTDKYSSDPRVHEICKAVGTGQLDRASAQAAAWNVCNNMSWSQLASKTIHHLGTGDSPYFSRDQLLRAQAIVAHVDGKVAQAKEDAAKSGSTTPSASTTSSSSIR